MTRGIDSWLPDPRERKPFFGVERVSMGVYEIRMHQPWRPRIATWLDSLLVRIGRWLNPWEAG